MPSRLEAGKLRVTFDAASCRVDAGVNVLRPVANLDRVDCRILNRLNAGSEELKPALRNRINKLRESGFVEDKDFGGVGITLRGQLALARWRFRKVPKPRQTMSELAPGAKLFGKIFKPN